MAEQEPITKLTDIIPIECEVTPTALTARLAWDKSKSVTIQLIDVTSFPDEICIGLLWQNYAKEIIKHIVEANEPRDFLQREKASKHHLEAIEHRLEGVKQTVRILEDQLSRLTREPDIGLGMEFWMRNFRKE